MLSGADRPGRSPISTTATSARSARDFITDRDAALAHHHERRDAPSGKPRQRRREQRPRVHLDRARGQAVGNHEGDVVAAAGVGGEPRFGVAGAGVGEAQIELRGGRERGAGARQRNARGGQRAQLRPRLILLLLRRVCWRAVLVRHANGDLMSAARSRPGQPARHPRA
jgi:hypothetical protein